jgi:hypothetical protein
MAEGTGRAKSTKDAYATMVPLNLSSIAGAAGGTYDSQTLSPLRIWH